MNIGGGQGRFSFGTGKSFEDLVDNAGVMAQSQKKNLEYGIVSGITLLTRYAIAAGVEESAAYHVNFLEIVPHLSHHQF